MPKNGFRASGKSWMTLEVGLIPQHIKDRLDQAGIKSYSRLAKLVNKINKENKDYILDYLVAKKYIRATNK